MNNRFVSLVAGVVCACSAAIAAGDASGPSERVEAAFVLGLGRTSTAAERQEWAGEENRSLAELISRQRQRLQSPAAGDEVRLRAWRDAFGRAPLPAEAEALAAGTTYAEQMQRLIGRLAARPDEYRQVVDRAYRAVLGRAPFAEEYTYWNGYPKISYILLVGCIENWARRNAPGLMVTTGTPAISVTSDRLTTLRLSPAVAAEARVVVGLPPAGERSLEPARGCNVIAPGAGAVVSVGGVYFTAIGGSAPTAAE